MDIFGVVFECEEAKTERTAMKSCLEEGTWSCAAKPRLFSR